MKWTPQELRIIELVRQGRSYKSIALELGLTRSAVSSYVHRIARLIPGDESPLRKILKSTD